MALLVSLDCLAATLRMVTTRDASVPASVSAGGASWGLRFSREGRFVVFSSAASDLVAGDVNGSRFDVFRRDLTSGQVTLISVTPAGTSARGNSGSPSVSADGRYVAFISDAPDLAPGMSLAGAQVYLRDTVDGTTRLVSVANDGSPADAGCDSPALSIDGRRIFFLTRARNLDPHRTARQVNLFVHDRVTAETRAVSVVASPDRLVPNSVRDVDEYAIRDDGGAVAFLSVSTNYASSAPTGMRTTCFIRDLERESTTQLTLPAVAGATGLTLVEARSVVFAPGRSRFAVAFSAPSFSGVAIPVGSTNLVQIVDWTNGAPVVVASVPGRVGLPVDDPAPLVFGGDGATLGFALAGQPGQPSELRLWRESEGALVMGVPGTGAAISSIRELAVSRDGRYLAFTSLATNLLAGGTPPNTPQLYLLDRASNRLDLLSADAAGAPIGGAESVLPEFGPDGRFFAFQSRASELVAGDRNGASDVFLGDAQTRAITLVSAAVRPSASAGDGPHSWRVRGLSAEGRFVLFSGSPRQFVAGVTNPATELLLRDLATGQITRVSEPGAGGNPDPAAVLDAVLSASGRYVAFVAEVPVERSPGGLRSWSAQVFLRDLARGTTVLVTAGADGKPAATGAITGLALTADGRYVAFATVARPWSSVAQGARPTTVVYDTVRRRISVPLTDGLAASLASFSLSGMGNVLAAGGSFGNEYRSLLYELETGRTTMLTGVILGTPQVSYDGRRLAWLAPGSTEDPRPRLTWRDLPVGSERSIASVPSTNLAPVLERLSADGRLAVIRQTPAGVPSSRGTFLVVELETGVSRPLEPGYGGDRAGSRVSQNVALSADGAVAVFQSRANDLVPEDLNPAADIFAVDLASTPIGAPVRLSAGGSSAGESAFGPLISADGTRVVFGAWADTLVPEDASPGGDVFVADLSARAATDRDLDGMDDVWEWTWFGGLARDGRGDYDKDGVSDGDEYLAGTSPVDDAWVFSVTARGLGEGAVELGWRTEPGRKYRLAVRDSVPGTWEPVGEVLVGDGKPARTTVPASSEGARFYRVSVVVATP